MVKLEARERGHPRRRDSYAIAPAEAGTRPSERKEAIGHSQQPHQLAFLTPGISPLSASSRKQIRHSPNWRRKARARPQRLQRLTLRTLNLGFFLFFAIQDFLAKLFLLRPYALATAWGAI